MESASSYILSFQVWIPKTAPFFTSNRIINICLVWAAIKHINTQKFGLPGVVDIIRGTLKNPKPCIHGYNIIIRQRLLLLQSFYWFSRFTPKLKIDFYSLAALGLYVIKITVDTLCSCRDYYRDYKARFLEQTLKTHGVFNS